MVCGATEHAAWCRPKGGARRPTYRLPSRSSHTLRPAQPAWARRLAAPSVRERERPFGAATKRYPPSGPRLGLALPSRWQRLTERRGAAVAWRASRDRWRAGARGPCRTANGRRAAPHHLPSTYLSLIRAQRALLRPALPQHLAAVSNPPVKWCSLFNKGLVRVGPPPTAAGRRAASGSLASLARRRGHTPTLSKSTFLWQIQSKPHKSKGECIDSRNSVRALEAVRFAHLEPGASYPGRAGMGPGIISPYGRQAPCPPSSKPTPAPPLRTLHVEGEEL